MVARPARPRRVAVILAAGKGTRMRSRQPKVLHPVAGRPMLHRVLDAARSAGCERLLVVVGHGADTVRAATEAAGMADGVEWVLQEEQRGTGDALARAEPHVEADDLLFVLSGDVPLLRPETLEALATAAATTTGGAMATATLDEPGRLGRVLADTAGDGLERIVEAADASADELAVRRINAGLYALPARHVFDDLRGVGTGNAQGELYLTDALGAAVTAGRPIALLELDDATEAFGINDRRDLTRAHRALIDRHLDTLLTAGVTILDPGRTVVEPEVAVGADTVLHAGVSLLGATRIGTGCVLHQGAWVRDCILADDVEVQPYCVLDGARVDEEGRVGPFTRLRPDAVLRRGARAGTFVEMKNAVLGVGARANHLSYLGDAAVGDDSNIGAGVVTCNYDGVRKHRTEIGAGAFIGSDTMLVAPVRIGDGATTAAGSTITLDVPDGALGVGRARQRTIEGWAVRRRDTPKS
ncbi:MAG: bifunctional UDP-N-acetylglucosamine diphosphorylase/glucosamine-1-phosphate N-acetyltransferase GlmU [Acidobacteriota bacterium]